MSSDIKNRLEVSTHDGYSADIAELLSKTIFGTEGKIRYRQKNIIEEMKTKKNLKFIQIRKGNRIFGTTGVIRRDTNAADLDFDSLYIRYLSINAAFSAKKKKRNTQQLQGNKKANNLRSAINELIIDEFEMPYMKSGKKAAFYAFVESDNTNSRNLCISLGFNPVRTISTFLFSRFSPQLNGNIHPVEHSEHDLIRTKLSEQYRGYSFYFEDQLFDRGTYFGLYQNDTLVAGLRARPVDWEMIHVPGVSGFVMKHILPYLPFTRRLFEPKHLKFLAFDYFWSENDSVEDSMLLMEHACASNNIHLGMIWEDQSTEFHDFLISSSRLGSLHALNGSVSADVMMRFANFSHSEEKELSSYPVFISALDMS